MYIHIELCRHKGSSGGIPLSQGMVIDLQWSSEKEAFILTLYTAKHVFK